MKCENAPLGCGCSCTNFTVGNDICNAFIFCIKSTGFVVRWSPIYVTKFGGLIYVPEYRILSAKFKCVIFFLFESLQESYWISNSASRLFANTLQTGGTSKRWLCILVWTENSLKTKLSKNDDVTMIMWFRSLPKFSLNTNPKWGQLMSRFAISPADCGWKTFDAFRVKLSFLNSSVVV